MPPGHSCHTQSQKNSAVPQSALTSPATKNSSGASSSLALYLAMIFSAMGWISCLAASDSPSSSESAGHRCQETKGQ